MDGQKNIFGYDDFMDIFGGPSQNWTILGVISIHFRVFLRSRHRMGILWGGGGGIPDIFRG